MHNTITVDGKLFTVCKDSWECSRLSAPVKQQFVTKERFEFVQAGHLGYLPEGVFVNRKIVYLRPDVYIVMDECYATGRHTYESYFHFNNEGSVTLDGSAVHYDGKSADAALTFLSGVELSKKTTHLSRRYNHEEENETVTAVWGGEGFTSCLIVIHAGARGELPTLHCEKIPVSSALKGTVYPDAMAEAVKLTLDQKEVYLAYAPLESLGWSFVTVMDVEEVVAPAYRGSVRKTGAGHKGHACHISGGGGSYGIDHQPFLHRLYKKDHGSHQKAYGGCGKDRRGKPGLPDRARHRGRGGGAGQCL